MISRSAAKKTASVRGDRRIARDETFSSFDAAIAGKWLQLLKEISVNIVRVAVIFNPGLKLGSE